MTSCFCKKLPQCKWDRAVGIDAEYDDVKHYLTGVKCGCSIVFLPGG